MCPVCQSQSDESNSRMQNQIRQNQARADSQNLQRNLDLSLSPEVAARQQVPQNDGQIPTDLMNFPQSELQNDNAVSIVPLPELDHASIHGTYSELLTSGASPSFQIQMFGMMMHILAVEIRNFTRIRQKILR